MSRRLTAAQKISRAIEGVGRRAAAAALLAQLTELVADEVREIYGNESQDHLTREDLHLRIEETYRVRADEIGRQTAHAYALRLERIASAADPEAIATLSETRDLSDALAIALQAMGG
jgi:hypothetical protein